MGAYSKLFHITWHPVVFSFSFTSKELRNDPWAKLREDLEQLDIKYSAEYEHTLTSHVVSKKRNTSKGLQALINGKYIVTDSFITAVVEAATTSNDAEPGAASALEQNYDRAWPNPLEHLPPRGEEPSERPAEAYSPDERRQEIFDGYTFVFYEKKQYDNLFSAVTMGKGKAVLKEVFPGDTDVDDFIGYVKGLAGEKDLGSFRDGSEGKGVVVVRYLPAKGSDFDWYAEFLASVAQRLDQRPMDQREFLEAILACDASMLRRPLEEDSQSQSAPIRSQPAADVPDRMEVDRPTATQVQSEPPPQAPPPSTATQRRGRPRRTPGSRFKGFDLDADDDAAAAMEEPQSSVTPTSQPEPSNISQSRRTQPQAQLDPPIGRSQRKRPHSPIAEETPAEIMDELAPTAAAVKRRRIELGETPIPATAPEADDAMAEDEEEDPTPAKGKAGARGKKKVKAEVDILELARQHREEEEARAAAERDALNQLPDDGIDYAAIRRMQIVEECEVRPPQSRSRDADGNIDGGDKWDARWNGRQNFKEFRKQGQPAGRQTVRTIVPLQEVKTKEYGIGDDYWLEDESAAAGKKKDSQRETQTQTQTMSQKTKDSRGKENENTPAKPASSRRAIVVDSSDDDEELPEVSQMPAVSAQPEAESAPELPRTRTAKAAEKAVAKRATQTQTQTQTQAQTAPRASKRAATTVPAKEKPAKKPRRSAAEVHDSDESEDEPRFRFGRR
jgi:DNA repair protein XRS2